jgi:hypothetical protein
MMDDVGAASWRYGKKLLTSTGEDDHPELPLTGPRVKP